jgi:ATP-dependent DNA helicase RecG
MALFDLSSLSDAARKNLSKLGIQRTFDLILHLPLRYDDETQLVLIANTVSGEMALVEGVITQQEVKYHPRRQLLLHIEDGSGVLIARYLHFYPNQTQLWKEGTRVRLFGEVRQSFFAYEMIHPRCKIVEHDEPLAHTLTPYYSSVAGLTQPHLRKWIAQALTSCDLSDTLPEQIRTRLSLMSFAQSVNLLHHPPPNVSLTSLTEHTHPAWERLKFDELLAQQLSMRTAHHARQQHTAPILASAGTYAAQLLTYLPFTLTHAQERVFAEIRTELRQAYPMQRLLQGDVGSGKTIVAALAAMDAIEAGFQVALMAPTEILAEQHYLKFKAWLAPLNIEIAWLTGGLKKKDKTAAIDAIATGQAQLAIGTHALFQEGIEFAKLGLAIVDEQHRFGVHQRLALRAKGISPHQLMMSATPIPRTLAMSYYADLDVSTIDELPPGRTPVITKLIAEERRADVIDLVAIQCEEGRQAYWVCPLIEESEALQLQTAIDTHALLKACLPHLHIGLIHGKMKPAEKAEIMMAFKANTIQLLVATTVIEVGVDVPNATLMVIEHAERMGLSQLHQLRGRVGRGAAKSACLLLYTRPLSDNAKMRLKIIFEHTDGFVIAQEDLKLRGPGELLGARQSGLPMLRFADLERDLTLLEAARELAPYLLTHMPEVAQAHLQRWLGNRAQLLTV